MTTETEQAVRDAAERGQRVRVRVRKRRTRLWRLWHRVRRPLLWTGMGLVTLLVVLAIDVAVRYLPAVRALQHGRDAALQAKQILSNDVGHIDRARLEQARALLVQAHADFSDHSQTIQDGWLAGVAGKLPYIGNQVDGARALRAVGDSGTQLGLDLIPVLEDVLPNAKEASATPLQRATRIASDRASVLADVDRDLDRLHAAIAQVPSGSLIGPLDSGRVIVNRDGPRIEDAVHPAIGLLRALPVAVGPGRHSYLLLLSNPGEERPGGGFIGAVGQLTFTDSQLSEAAFRPSFFSNDLVKNVPTPEPLDIHLFRGNGWELSDANWSPDFPTAVADITRIYTAATGAKVDGVIEVDPVALGYVLAVLGPAQVPPYPQTITAANALRELNYITNSARPGDPGKVFLPAFGHVLVDELLHAKPPDWPALADALQRGARETHIVMHFNEARLQKLIDGTPAAGQVPAPLSDSLLVADANLSGGKQDLFVTRQYRMTATVGRDGEVHDHLELTYRNPAPPDPADAYLVKAVGGAYRDFVQVVVPETATITGMQLTSNGTTTRVSPDSVSWEFQREIIGFWFIVPRNGTVALTLDYTGPFADSSVSPETYQFAWQHQLNALTWSVELTVVMPNGKRFDESSELSVDRRWSFRG